jgi:hypothetical protein
MTVTVVAMWRGFVAAVMMPGIMTSWDTFSDCSTSLLVRYVAMFY